jgi:hypothetical protein
MVGLLFLLAAASSSQSAAMPARAPGFRPTATASAHATARIRVISGVKFGPDFADGISDALRRSTRLIEYDGQVRSAELLEFQ